MRYKKQIIFICLLTFLFLPMSGKYEEPKAEVLTLTTGVIVGCAALATACGVVINNPDMLEDVGERIYNGIKDIPGAIENVGDNIKFNVTKDLLSTVVSLCNDFPVADYIKKKIEFSSLSADSIVKHGCWNGYLTFTPSKDMRYLRIYYNGTLKNEVGFQISAGTTYTLRAEYIQESNGEWYQRFYDSINGSLIGGSSLSWSTSSHVTDKWTITALNSSKLSIPLSYEYGNNVCIPYTEKNTESVSSEKPKEYFPVGSGSISVPVDKPLTDYNPSVDNPISLPSDLVGDGISADVSTDDDSTTGDVSLDKPNTDVVDSPTTGDSLWDTLMSWLKTLFAPLVALLEWIGNLLKSIWELLKGLVESLINALKGLLDLLIEALKGLFEYLFVPTLDIATLITIPDDSGLGQLVELFDWGELFDITPKPYVFETNLNFYSLTGGEDKVWNLRFDLFSNESVDKFMPYVRNILSYSTLIGVIGLVIFHFLPKHDID